MSQSDWRPPLLSIPRWILCKKTNLKVYSCKQIKTKAWARLVIKFWTSNIFKLKQYDYLLRQFLCIMIASGFPLINYHAIAISSSSSRSRPQVSAYFKNGMFFLSFQPPHVNYSLSPETEVFENARFSFFCERSKSGFLNTVMSSHKSSSSRSVLLWYLGFFKA